MWSALWLAFVVVVVGGAGWFLWKSGLLSRSLNDHYARTIARFGREVEARQENYVKLIENLTEIASEADTVSAEELALKGAEARALAIHGAEESVKARAKALRTVLERFRGQVESMQASVVNVAVKPELGGLKAALDEAGSSLAELRTVGVRIASLRIRADDLRDRAERTLRGEQAPFASEEEAAQQDSKGKGRWCSGRTATRRYA